MLVNRRMAEISEIMCGKVLMTYDELSGMLERRSGWLEAKTKYRGCSADPASRTGHPDHYRHFPAGRGLPCKSEKAGADSMWYKDASEESLIDVTDRTMEGEHIFPDKSPAVTVGSVRNDELTAAENDTETK